MTTLSTDAAKLSSLAATDQLLISLVLVREKLIYAKKRAGKFPGAGYSTREALLDRPRDVKPTALATEFMVVLD